MEIELPGILHVIHSRTLPKDKAEESLLYVRYLLLREDDPAKVKQYHIFKDALQHRINELDNMPEPQEKATPDVQ